MDIDSIPLFSMLKDKMGYLNQRQSLIAQNVANADTPGFTPKDLTAFKVQSSSSAGGTLSLAPVTKTDPGHLSGMTAMAASAAPQGQTYKAVNAPDGETRLDGNQVVMEEQMMKMNDTRNDFDAAVGIYQKAMSFLTLAAKEPGK